jgi:cardiolipin synthase (CMP-forming)
VSLHFLPNLLTLLRLLLALPIALCILQGLYGWATLLFLIAGFSDGLDGFLAKRYGWSTPLGGLLDPLADKLLITLVLVTLALQGLLPIWLVALAIARDLIIALGALLYRYLIGPYEAAPSLISKINTGVLLLLVLAVLVAQLQLPLPVPALLPQALVGLAVLTVLLSGGGYVLDWSRRARRARRAGA